MTTKITSALSSWEVRVLQRAKNFLEDCPDPEGFDFQQINHHYKKFTEFFEAGDIAKAKEEIINIDVEFFEMDAEGWEPFAGF